VTRNEVRYLSRWKVYWIVGLVILAGCQGVLPCQMIGTWSTQDPRYAGRSLHIGADTIVFIADEDNKTPGSIRKVRTKARDASLWVKIEYVDNEQESQTAELVYLPEYGGSLSFRNQPGVVWRKVDQ
jgi:hypothetical protein